MRAFGNGTRGGGDAVDAGVYVATTAGDIQSCLVDGPSNRCYTGGCFIARFAAWPLRVTRLTEILIESETTPPLCESRSTKKRRLRVQALVAFVF